MITAMTRRLIWRVVLLSTLLLVGCGDDGGTNGTVDAAAATDAVIRHDASIDPSDAALMIDAAPLPPDASTVGAPCNFPETIALSLSPSGVGGAMVCVDPTGTNCRVIPEIRSSCFNDQVGFGFGLSVPMDDRRVRGIDGLVVTGGTAGTLAVTPTATFWVVADNTPSTVTTQSPAGQSYTVAFEFNGTNLTFTSISGP